LIDSDSTRKVLLKTIKFPFVSIDLMKQFIENYNIDEIDFDLFQSLKERLIFD
jgi:hypothetical protein